MTYLIIAAVVLVAIAPIFWFKPTPRQRQLEVLRYTAQRAGLQVRIAPHPDTATEKPQLDSILYFVLWTLPPEKREGEACRWTLVRNSFNGEWSPWEGWRWIKPGPRSVREAIATILPQLPESCCGLEASSLGVGFYWNERPAIPDAIIPVMLPALQELRAAIEALPIPKRVA